MNKKKVGTLFGRAIVTGEIASLKRNEIFCNVSDDNMYSLSQFNEKGELVTSGGGGITDISKYFKVYIKKPIFRDLVKLNSSEDRITLLKEHFGEDTRWANVGELGVSDLFMDFIDMIFSSANSNSIFDIKRRSNCLYGLLDMDKIDGLVDLNEGTDGIIRNKYITTWFLSNLTDFGPYLYRVIYGSELALSSLPDEYKELYSNLIKKLRPVLDLIYNPKNTIFDFHKEYMLACLYVMVIQGEVPESAYNTMKDVMEWCYDHITDFFTIMETEEYIKTL